MRTAGVLVLLAVAGCADSYYTEAATPRSVVTVREGTGTFQEVNINRMTEIAEAHCKEHGRHAEETGREGNTFRTFRVWWKCVD